MNLRPSVWQSRWTGLSTRWCAHSLSCRRKTARSCVRTSQTTTARAHALQHRCCIRSCVQDMHATHTHARARAHTHKHRTTHTPAQTHMHTPARREEAQGLASNHHRQRQRRRSSSSCCRQCFDARGMVCASVRGAYQKSTTAPLEAWAIMAGSEAPHSPRVAQCATAPRETI